VLLRAASLAGAWPAQAPGLAQQRPGREDSAARAIVDVVVAALRAKRWILGENYP
jgi:hypothetical protein